MSIATVALQEVPKEYKKFNLKSTVSDALKISGKTEITKGRKTTSTVLEREVALGISKTLLSSLSPEMMEICESYHCTKLTTQFKGLAKYSDGLVGTRSIQLSKYGKKLVGFEFNTDAPYKKTFKAKYHIKQGSRKDQVIIHFPAFVPDRAFKRSKEATNFKISARLVALSDFRYNQVEEKYEPLNADLHGKFSSQDSAMLPILKMPLDPMTSQLCLNQGFFPSNTSLFLITSVSFFVYDHGRFVHLGKEGSMQIKQVF